MREEREELKKKKNPNKKMNKKEKKQSTKKGKRFSLFLSPRGRGTIFPFRFSA